MLGEPWWFDGAAPDQVVWRFSGFDIAGCIVEFEFAGPKASSSTVMFRPACRIGRDRSRCEIVIDDPTISRCHAEIRFVPGEGVGIRDCGSSNGTFINGERVYDTFRLVMVRSVVTIGRLDLGVSVLR